MGTAYLAVDPGSNDTGLIIRRGPTLLWWRVVKRDTDEALVTGDRGVSVGPVYVRKVLAAIGEGLAWYAEHTGGGPIRLAAEDITAPTGHVKRKSDGLTRFTKPRYALGAAKVLGAIEAAWPDVVRIPPADHGHRILANYPPDLSTARERSARPTMRRPAGQSTDLRHCRSAWDVSLSAPAQARVQDATAKMAARLSGRGQS